MRCASSRTSVMGPTSRKRLVQGPTDPDLIANPARELHSVCWRFILDGSLAQRRLYGEDNPGRHWIVGSLMKIRLRKAQRNG